MSLPRFAVQTLAALVLACVAHVALAAPPVPLLWKVSDADNSVYLLGSFHLLKPADYPLSKDVDMAFDDAEALVFEIPPEEIGSPALAMQMGQAALRQDGTQLDSDLSPEVRKQLLAWQAANAGDLQNVGLAPQMLQMFEPWFVALTISVIDMARHGLDPKLGLDEHLAAAAEAKGKPTSGLETGAQQVAFLDRMDHDEQLQFLQEALTESAGGEKELETLHAAWRAGDIATLWDGMAVEMKRNYPKLYQRIDVERNDAWVPKIERMLAPPGHDDTLVVVGALHLLGGDGVVEKLRAKGYKVERICSACGGSRN
jgi:uncharacterized protein YbaP (TraB family)